MNGEYHWDLDEGTKLQVRKWQREVFVDIRKFYNDKPTTKGIALRPELFARLVALRERILAAIDLVKTANTADLSDEVKGASGDCWRDPEGSIVFLLDKNTKAKVYKFKNHLLVDIRSFFKDAPTKKGISLAPALFNKLLDWSDWQVVVNKVK